MTTPPPLRPRSTAPLPQPRFALGVLYVLGFFFVYCLALVGPELYEVFVSMPPSPEMEKAAYRVAEESIRGRLGWAFFASLATVAGLAWARVLPGVKRS